MLDRPHHSCTTKAWSTALDVPDATTKFTAAANAPTISTPFMVSAPKHKPKQKTNGKCATKKSVYNTTNNLRAIKNMGLEVKVGPSIHASTISAVLHLDHIVGGPFGELEWTLHNAVITYARAYIIGTSNFYPCISIKLAKFDGQQHEWLDKHFPAIKCATANFEEWSNQAVEFSRFFNIIPIHLVLFKE
ncbi:related to MON1-required for fusion of cvt-vesicles and autophagosomes with the vacuole [Sporisorium scitamineum]|uniref:Related to MON1-required for fusion of cvt-vesicles and autophagosomes with the vacuole n=1 Tax=Sporisorium scitamineum TaxID=49012 RepID=A0A0F7SAP1_9BASI|nr:related to MON1-required for fusion of cvt-vesicles and autophagosomes with the vacuole [Sporisorium scitamineum]CDW97753.1 hypothetical protein [Sporisorium scitamineum]